MYRVAITDYTFPSLEIEEKILAGKATLAAAQCKTPELLIPHVADADAVLVQFAPVNAAVVNAMTKARVIVRYGIGVDNVDLDAARNRSIRVCNVPDYCIDEVADHALAFILSVTRQVIPNCLHIRAGKWGLATPLDRLTALRDQTVGCVGFGRIGREVLARLAPFGSRRLVFDPYVSPERIREVGCEPASLDQIFSTSDIVTLHSPSTPDTRRLLNRETLAKCRTGVVVVNLARGDLIETAALVDALKSGQVSAAALDVCDPEPIPLDSPLRSLPNVVLSSHIASASLRAVKRLRESAADIVLRALNGEPLPNIVNGLK